MASTAVICAGIVVVDHVAAPIDHLPAAGELVLTDDCLLTTGGCASNVAVDLAKLGVPTLLAGCVGDDPFGSFASDSLDQAGVDVSRLKRMAGVPTSQTLIVNVKGQDRRFIHCLGANQIYGSDHVPTDRFAGAKVLYVGGYFLMPRLTPVDLATVFQSARAAGLKTVLDVVIPGSADYLAGLRTILPTTDVFHLNHDEAKLVTGLSDAVAQARLLVDLGAGAVVVTQGDQGCVLATSAGVRRADTFKVNFVDGTGGGDAFVAGYILGLLEDAPVDRCLTLGSALGASCVQKTGATAGVFNRRELHDFLQHHTIRIEAISET